MEAGAKMKDDYGGMPEFSPAMAMEESYDQEERGPSRARTQSLSLSQPPQPGDPAPAQERPRMVIYRNWLTLAVHAIGEALAAAEAITFAAGGYIESATLTQRVLRVPVDKQDQVLAALKELGQVRAYRQSSQDITEAFHDTKARLENLQAIQARLAQLAAQATDLSVRIALERELRRISIEIAKVQEELRAMANLAAFTTITLDVTLIETHVARAPHLPQPFAWPRTYGLATLFQ